MAEYCLACLNKYLMDENEQLTKKDFYSEFLYLLINTTVTFPKNMLRSLHIW